MKKYFYILAALSIVPNFALAQSFDNEVDSELDQIATQQQQVVAPAQALPAQQATVIPANQQPIYILNQGSPVAAQSAQAQQPAQQQQAIQKQPTTLIEASPLTESRAEQIRKARQDAEVQTEQKIVEKLEASRMEDEKKRADVLFGNKFSQLQDQSQQQQQQPVQQVQQPVYVQPAPVQQVQVQQKQDDNSTRDMVREEIRAAMKTEDEVADAPIETRYFGAMAGIGDYPDVRNVHGNYSLGASFGTIYDNSLIVEGSFMYSNYSVDQLVFVGGNYYGGSVDMNQYSGALSAKYQFLSGLIRPILGGVVQYSYRTFAWNGNGNGYSYTSSDTADSHAIDVGVVTGVDLAFNSKFSLGLDFRYLWNLSSRVNNSNNSYWMPGYQSGTPVEKLQYYVMSLVGKVTF